MRFRFSSPGTKTPTLRWWMAIVATGILAGIIGAAVDLFSSGVEWLTFGHSVWRHEAGLREIPAWRRVLFPLVAAVISAVIWRWLRHGRRGESAITLPQTSVQAAVRGQELDSQATALDGTAQVLAVSAGLSIGREVTPRLLSAWAAQRLGRRINIEFRDSLTLVASAAGAGLASSYNVPLAGTALTMQLLSQKPERTWRRFVAALVINLIATVVAWPIVGHSTIYTAPRFTLTRWAESVANLEQAGIVLAVLVAVGICGLLAGWLFTWTMKTVLKFVCPTRYLWASIPAVMMAVIAASWFIPQLPGNGRSQVQYLLLNPTLWWVAAVMMIAKIIATGFTLQAGASSGMLTPGLATGAAVGAAIAHLTGFVDEPMLTAIVMAGMATVLGTTQRAYLFAFLFTLELCHPGLVTILAIGISCTLARGLNELREFIQHTRPTRREVGHSQESLN